MKQTRWSSGDWAQSTVCCLWHHICHSLSTSASTFSCLVSSILCQMYYSKSINNNDNICCLMSLNFVTFKIDLLIIDYCTFEGQKSNHHKMPDFLFWYSYSYSFTRIWKHLECLFVCSNMSSCRSAPVCD